MRPANLDRFRHSTLKVEDFVKYFDKEKFLFTVGRSPFSIKTGTLDMASRRIEFLSNHVDISGTAPKKTKHGKSHPHPSKRSFYLFKSQNSWHSLLYDWRSVSTQNILSCKAPFAAEMGIFTLQHLIVFPMKCCQYWPTVNWKLVFFVYIHRGIHRHNAVCTINGTEWRHILCTNIWNTLSTRTAVGIYSRI